MGSFPCDLRQGNDHKAVAFRLTKIPIMRSNYLFLRLAAKTFFGIAVVLHCREPSASMSTLKQEPVSPTMHYANYLSVALSRSRS